MFIKLNKFLEHYFGQIMVSLTSQRSQRCKLVTDKEFEMIEYDMSGWNVPKLKSFCFQV